MTREEVVAAIKVMLQEDPESEHQVDWLMRCPNFDILFDTMIKHTKFKQQAHDIIASMVGSKVKSPFEDVIFDHKQNFLAPRDLQTTTLERKRVLLIGQCFFYDWKGVAEARRLPVEAQQFVIGYQHEVPDSIMEKGDEFDFQILQAPIRAVIPEVPYFRMALNDAAGFEHLFKVSKERLETFVRYMTKFNTKNNLETYFCNFITPQASIDGRFGNRYDLGNIIYFIDELNRHLYNIVLQIKNVYYVDLNNIAAVYGKMFVRDDVCMSSLHGGTLTNRDAAFGMYVSCKHVLA